MLKLLSTVNNLVKASLSITIFLLLGCSSGEPTPSATATPKKSAAPKAQDSAAVEAAPRKSAFAIDKDYRDPFFPSRTLAKPETTAQAPAAPLPSQVVALLEKGFQGVIGTANRRFAMINNTILEPNKTVVIALKVGAQTENIPVHCIDVLKNSVLLEIPGQAAPVSISRTGFEN